MKTIGENIATLRKNQGMTQESLSLAIGVSTQAISKWENNTNMPDISLLPVISSIFGVSIDELFGKSSEKTYYSFDEVCDRTNEEVLNILGNAFYDGNESVPYDRYIKRYKNDLKKNDKLRTAVFRDGNIVYHRNGLGSILLKKPADGWASYLCSENIEKATKVLGNVDFIKFLKYIIITKMYTFTVSSICSKCDIKDVKNFEDIINESGLFTSKTLDIGDESVNVYELKSVGRLYILFAVFALVSEYDGYQEIYFNYVGG